MALDHAVHGLELIPNRRTGEGWVRLWGEGSGEVGWELRGEG
jgi:hypothetical protein